MDDPIEIVARAIGEVYDGCADPVETPNNWGRAMEAARAALLALREPTEGMVEAGYAALMAWDARTGDDMGITEVWRAAIDHALQTQEKGNG